MAGAAPKIETPFEGEAPSIAHANGPSARDQIPNEIRVSCQEMC
jgi:hypothetical protein